jgi:hypothetical protein
MERKNMKIVYVITSRENAPRDEAGRPKKYWNRIGVAFVNSDGSINVKLEALPVSGELQIRDYSAHREAGPTFTRVGEPPLAQASA